ncbi:hypothetical protein FS749_004881 [Ceratobasidium sp. UAMH 11750]|nr:hypothetical protein FS749_004881 [Ceratobasidium sp. UAMH 11750]
MSIGTYEKEQPKSPSETTSLHSHSSSGRSNLTPGPSRNWLRRSRTRNVPNQRAPSAHRSRSRSSSLQTARRVGGYMHSDVDLTSAERRSSHDGTISPSRGRPGPQGLFALNSLPVPARRGDSAYSRHQPSSPQSKSRGREQRISPLSISPTYTHQSESESIPSPSTHSWTADSEIDPAADSEMWSSISRLEDELVSRFGRGVVPPLTALRPEKTLAPPQASTSRTRTPSLPDQLAATLQCQPPLHSQNQNQNAKLTQPTAPRQVHRTRSTPALAFPLPPPTLPDWVTSAPLPTPPGPQQAFPPASPLLRAKIGPPPPFAPPPNFPPPAPPVIKREDRDTEKELEALVALYEVLEAGYRTGTVGTTKPRPSMGRSGGLGKPGEAHGLVAQDSRANGPRRKVLSAPKPFAGLRENVVEEEESDVMPSGIVAHAY